MKFSINPLNNAISVIRAVASVMDLTIIIVQNVDLIIFKRQIKNVCALMEDTSIKILSLVQFALLLVHHAMVLPLIIVQNVTQIFSYNQTILAKNVNLNFISTLNQVNACPVVSIVINVKKIQISVLPVLKDLI